jgi:hypothetical protein
MGEKEGEGAKSYDGEKAWFSIKHMYSIEKSDISKPHGMVL